VSVTISSVSPTAGHTGGKTIVEIDGTGFVVPATPPPAPVTGLTPVAPPSMAVFFGNVPALMVSVVNATTILAVAPPTAPTADSNGIPQLATTVAISVMPLDGSGNPIPGQGATLAAAYTFQLPDLTIESDLTRVIRTWIGLVRAQVTPNFSWPKSTDFDQATGDFLSLVDLPRLPGLVIADATLRTNDFYSLRAPVDVDNGDGTFTTKAPPDTVDIVMTIVGVTNDPTELLNLTAAFKRFLHKNPSLVMVRDPSNLALGSVQYELAWWEGKEVKVTSAANANNLSHFAYDVAIVGFDIEDMPGLPAGGPGDTSRAHEATVDLTSEAETINVLPSLVLPFTPPSPPTSQGD